MQKFIIKLNKEKRIAQMKVIEESKKDGYYTVYYLKGRTLRWNE